MRLGEVRNILGAVLSEDNRITLEHEAIFGGQGQRISNFNEIIKALDVLSEQDWNSLDYSQIEAIKQKHTESSVVILDAEEFNQLSSYINSVNNQVPLFYSFVNSFVEDQSEKTLNIKLPENDGSFTFLNSINNRLEAIFKLFNIDGEFQIRGFDKGSEWYVLAVGGLLSYKYALGCLKIAQEYLKTKNEYFKSEEAKIHYEIAQIKEEAQTDAGFNEYQTKYLGNLLSKRITVLIDHIKETNGKESPELHSQLVIATGKLVKELDAGTEFHLSLNPPEYAKEQGGVLDIDYKKLYTSTPLKKSEPKSLQEAPKKASDNGSE